MLTTILIEQKKAVWKDSPQQVVLTLFLLFEVAFVTIHELINPSCSVNKLHLTSIKRMRSV